MSILVDCPAALVASPRPCAPVAGGRLRADDAQPRLTSRPTMPIAHEAWHTVTGFATRGLETATAKHDFSIRSGPPTSRPPA